MNLNNSERFFSRINPIRNIVKDMGSRPHGRLGSLGLRLGNKKTKEFLC
jgi:hypothetical protein